MFDTSILEDLKKLSNSLIFIVDNTWLSIASYNPFDYGADFCVISLTKYYSGGLAIAGTVFEIIIRCGYWE
jgi:cystathionine beta-lyase/cystathionine gamma-synthase